MQATISLAVGLVIGVIVFVIVGRGVSRQGEPPTQPTVLGWSALILGAFAFLAGALMMTGLSQVASVQTSLASAGAAMVVSIGALVKRDQRWPTWVGLALGAVPGLFWIVFFVGEFIFPH